MSGCPCRCQWQEWNRTRQLILAARNGHLYYATDGRLMHHAQGPASERIPATGRDQWLVGELVKDGQLVRDEDGRLVADQAPAVAS